MNSNFKMNRRILIVLAISTTLFACDFSKQLKVKADNDIKTVKVAMDSDMSNAKTEFSKLYKQAVQQSKDSVFSTNAGDLYSSITKTSAYIDSLRIEMDNLDYMDPKNMELVQRMFLYKGIGDSVFNKIIRSYSLATQVALADSSKSRLIKVQEGFTRDKKILFFEVQTPLGVNMLLYGIELDLIRDGSSSLYEHLRI
ncbi:hypothetical protein QTN47_21825 [Danxiaibacter flavus]|uniref:Gliding motility-associated protein GldM N-terminal domain-containing protein n=1 Tax=Danxiaibacter flavus TaxID=3049108 RepID=A0ABV3ZM38_9BACT|nr:hypothetical protein QNM32_21830 [Chitinophagaceae bacterium DXS]